MTNTRGAREVMIDWLASAAKSHPDALALLADERAWTYADLQTEVSALAGRLAAAGVKRGQHVSVLMASAPEYVFVVHALARLGAVIVPLNTRLTARELAWQVDRADCALLLHDEQYSSLASAASERTRALSELPRAESCFAGSLALDTVQSILFTSGTTGNPKGAQISFAAQLYSAAASSWRLGHHPDDRWLLCLPLYHVGGLNIILRSCLYGSAIILQRGFDPHAIWQALEAQAVTLISLVPTMLDRLLEARPNAAPPATLRLVLLGGAAAMPTLVQRAHARGFPIALTYGLTEANSQVATALPDAVRRKPGSVGKPLMFSDVRITSDSGALLPVGQVGEIVVRGPTVMLGYYRQPEHPALRDGSLYTGDLGYLDEDGDLWVVQRRSDLIISGGENIYPAEIEAVLREHPSIADVCVVGVDDPIWGQRPAAAIVLKPETALSQETLEAFVRERLAGYKVPRSILFVEALPHTASGKVARPQVAALFTQQPRSGSGVF
ncbi:MAG: o-succinylbenzoate--CoA ligase [Aggregatilineales bacterium]